MRSCFESHRENCKEVNWRQQHGVTDKALKGLVNDLQERAKQNASEQDANNMEVPVQFGNNPGWNSGYCCAEDLLTNDWATVNKRLVRHQLSRDWRDQPNGNCFSVLIFELVRDVLDNVGSDGNVRTMTIEKYAPNALSNTAINFVTGVANKRREAK